MRRRVDEPAASKRTKEKPRKRENVRVQASYLNASLAHILRKVKSQSKSLEWYEQSLGDGSPVFVYLPSITVLSALGYHAVVMDYRGFGDSTGEPTVPGLTTDAICLYNWVRARSKGSLVIFWGHSLGTLVSSITAVKLQELGTPPDAVILEGAFTNMDLPEDFPHPFIWYYWRFPYIQYYFYLDSIKANKFEFVTPENVNKMRMPLMILHSKDDHLAPFWMAEEMTWLKVAERRYVVFHRSPQAKRFGISLAENLHYDDKEEVVLWMNTVGPYHNRQETYKYFSLPFCVGTKKTISHYHETLGEALQGVELEFSGLDIKFKDEVMQTTYCEIELDKAKRDAFVYAIKNHYWYQMYIDDLPIWGIVGEADENGEDHYLWTYKKLEIGFNGNRIVDVNLTSEGKVKLVPNTRIAMSYSVKWKKSDVKFEDRFDKYLDPSFFQHRIHWFSIFNSFMMVIFLVGLVSMILMRTLRKDYARYSKEEEMDDMDRDLGDEYGWKQVHGDVFRPSSHPLIFSSLIGSGCQIFSVSLIVIIVAMLEDLYTERGSMLSTAIFVYAATSPVNGYFGGSLYAKQGGRRWIKQMFIGAFLIPAMVCGTAFFINFIAIYYHASRAIPFGTMVAVCCICFFVILPLNLVGTILGRNLSGQPNFPCRVNAVPRPIPEKKWFMEPAVIVCLGGILPFGSIFIEMYFIFTSFWAYKIYYVYGFMMLVLVILCIVTVCVTIVCTYFLLNAEDYRWQWTSFLSAASTAVYVYMYSFYYYFFKTKMYGLFQTSFYFGYMAVFSTALGIMC
ncbi:transmembrane 9 superfamily member 3, partial [Clarias magur]